MKPTDLFEIDTSQFSQSLPKDNRFTNRPELAQAAREQISQLKEVVEESIVDGRSDLFVSPAKSTKKFDASLGKSNGFENEVDGLINWANNLPDEFNEQFMMSAKMQLK